VFNTLLIATAIGLSTRQRIMRVWNENFLWSAPSYFVGALAAAIAASVIDRGGYWMASLAAAPLYLTYAPTRSTWGGFRISSATSRRSRTSTWRRLRRWRWRSTPKIKTAQSHIRRVQVYAAGLAGRSHAGDRDSGRQEGGAAARHRQAGGARDILSKPGPLTQEEFQKIPDPSAGRRRESSAACRSRIRWRRSSHHHERWDGKGYPSGLVGEAIPLGARFSRWSTTSTR